MDRQTALAFVVCIGIFLCFNFFVFEHPEGPPPVEGLRPVQGGDTPRPEADPGPAAPRGTDPPGAPGGDAPEGPSDGAPGGTPPSGGAWPASLSEEERLIETGRYRARLSNRGAGIASLHFLDYKAKSSEEPLELLFPVDGLGPSLALSLGEGFSEGETTALWEPVAGVPGDEGVGRDVGPRGVAWRWRAAEGVWVYKAVDFPPGEAGAADPFDLRVRVVLQNTGGEACTLQYRLDGASGLRAENLARSFGQRAVVALRESGGATHVETVGIDAVRERPVAVEPSSAPPIWCGVESQYFAVLLEPDADTMGSLRKVVVRGAATGQVQPGGGPDECIAGYRSRPLKLAPGSVLTHGYTLFVGPKQQDVLEAYGARDFVQLLGVDMWRVNRPLAWLFHAILVLFHRLTGDYGVAIILLTLLVRSCIHPLSVKSQRSMLAMQKVQPEMEAIRARHKNPKSKQAAQKMNQEVMELYRRHGVNPFGGCLPIFIQLPVFIGLYNAIGYAFELRQAAFAFTWIRDLSQPDRLLVFDPPIPLIFFPLGELNILPLLMVCTYLIQQALMPKATDERMQQQQKMMKFMFVIFGFLFYSMPSGLVLYFLTSSLVGIAEQQWIRRRLGSVAPVPAVV
ncbi:MAG: membrane protein insertase YidC [Planctomycetes bacterium]|nr:membrane protein insertase YidC [Planctomycetota bacterium]